MVPVGCRPSRWTVSDATLYAHQGGWDEILFVLAPLIVFAVLLLVARRRVERMEAEEPDDTDVRDQP